MPTREIAVWFEKEFGIEIHETISIIKKEVDKDGDGTVTFKEFDKFVQKLLGK